MTTKDDWIQFLEFEHKIKRAVWQKRGLTFDSSYLYIPILDQNGNKLYVKKRKSPKASGGSKYLNEANTPIAIYPWDKLADALTLFLCEGELDSLTLESYGIAAVTSTGGAQGFKPEFIPYFHGKQVIICYDNVDAGKQGAARVGNILSVAGVEVKILTLPEMENGKDIADYFRSGKAREEFVELCKHAATVTRPTSHEAPDKFAINDFDVKIIAVNTLELTKDDIMYKVNVVKDLIVDIAAYVNEKLVNRERFALTSGRARTTFVNKCIGVDSEIKSNITIHLVDMIAVLEELTSRRLNEEEAAANQSLSEEEITDAKRILVSPTLMYDILSVIKKGGIVGEEENALAHYLTFTSRILDDPISVVVKGESSAGKSYVLGVVMLFIPEEAYVDITDATPQSFYYAKKDRFAHKIIVIFEKHGQEKSDYSIRSFQSEKKLKIQVTVKDPQTGQFIAKELTVDGPIGFITTTTDARIHSENETRVLSLFPDESIQQTERIMSVINNKYSGHAGMSSQELNRWQNIQRVITPYQTIIPYANHLSAIFPKKPTRVRRDYEKLLGLISAITLLHQYQRQKTVVNGQEFLVATLADFYIAKILFEQIFQKTIFELSPKSVQLVSAATELVSNDQEKTITIKDLARHLDWDYDTAQKWFEPAFRKGYFNLIEEHRGSKAATYRPSDKKPSDQKILPEVEDLFEQDQSWLSHATVYNPLSGEILKFQAERHSTDVPIEDKAQ